MDRNRKVNILQGNTIKGENWKRCKREENFQTPKHPMLNALFCTELDIRENDTRD